jgi:hypothetical protein
MSSHCLESGAYLDRATAAQQSFVSDSVLQEPLMVDKRPWLAHAFMELLQLQRVGRVEPGIGDFRVTDETLKSAGRVLCGIRHRHLPNPSLSTLSGGGVQITWTNGENAVEISVLPGDDVALALLVNDALTKSVELRPSDYDQMNQCLADLVGL